MESIGGQTPALDDLEKSDTQEESRNKSGGAFSILFCGQCCLILLLIGAIPTVLIALNNPPAPSVAAAPTISPTSLPTASPTISTPLPTTSPTLSPVPTPKPTKSPTKSPVPTPNPTKSPTKSPVPTPNPTESPSLSPTTPAPTYSPTPSPTRVVSCAITPVTFEEDEGRVQDPGDESIVTINGASKPFTVTVEIETSSAFQSLSGLDLATTSLGEVYNTNGSVVSTVPASSFVESPPGMFTLTGLRFLPRADLGVASSKVTHSVTFSRADGGLDTDENCVSKVESCGKADVPEIVSSGGCFNVSERGSVTIGITSLLKDTDNSEAIHRYIVSVVYGDEAKIGSLNDVTTIAATTEVAPQSCASACQTGQLVVSPAGVFAGSFGFDINAQSREKTNACSLGDQFATSSDSISFHFDVYPVASEPKFAVLDAKLNEDERPVSLFDQTIIDSLALDGDGSETLFLILFNDSLPTGATVEVGGSPASPNGQGEFVLNVPGPTPEIFLAANSNEDAALRVRVRVVDEALVETCGTGSSTIQDVYESSDKFINLKVKGVADPPVVTGVVDSATVSLEVWTKQGTELSTLILEDEITQLDFSFESGENGDKQAGDTSETLSAVLIVPEDVLVYNSTLLSFIGTNDGGDLMYAVPVDLFPEIYIGSSTEHSTDDLTATIVVVVTEDDGNSLESSFLLNVNIQPVIDAEPYVNVIGNPECPSPQIAVEDTEFTLNYLPNLADPSESFYSAEISGVPPFGGLSIEGSLLTPSLGIYYISITDIGKPLVYVPEEDSDQDLVLTTSVTVLQNDPDGEPNAIADIAGIVAVSIRAKVEADGVLALLLPGGGTVTTAASDANGVVDLTSSSSSGVISFIETDLSSTESIDGLMIEFPAATGPGFLVEGGIFDGENTWTVPNTEISNIKIRALQGFKGSLVLDLHASVIDQGDTNTDASCELTVTSSLTVSFAANTFTCLTQNPAALTIPTGLSLSGDEDGSYSLSGLTTTVATAGDQGDDVMSVVFKSTDLAGASIAGAEEDFINTNFVQKAPVSGGGVADFSAVSLKPKSNFAGDVEIDVTFVNLDTVCGGFVTGTRTITVRVSPVVDATDIEIVLEGTQGLNGDELPVAYHGGMEAFVPGVAKEDGIVVLKPMLATGDNGDLSTGEETITSITLTVQTPAEGSFVDNTTGVTSTSFVGTGDSTFFFVPAAHFSGDVAIDISATVEDAASYSLTTPSIETDTSSISSSFTVTVIPVCDFVAISSGVVVTGLEDATGISLADIAYSMDDSDGSETLLAFIVKGLPNGFKATPATNLGSAGWRFAPGGGSNLAGLSIVPPPDFSGSLNLSMVALAQEELLEETEFCTTTMPFTLVVQPVPEPVKALIISAVDGVEGVDMSVTLNAKSSDDSVQFTGISGVAEGAAETIMAILTNVPEGAFFRNISTITATKLSPTSWSVQSSDNELDVLSFNSGETSGVISVDVAIFSVDNGVTLFGPVTGTIEIDITPVNDPPVNSIPGPISLSGANSVIISGISIEDVDIDAGEMKVDIEPLEPGSSILAYPPSGSGVTVTELAGPILSLTGTLADLNDLLDNGLNYTGPVGNIRFVTNDQQTVPGPVGVTTDTIEIVT